MFYPRLEPAQSKLGNSEIEQDLPAIEILTPVCRSPLEKSVFPDQPAGVLVPGLVRRP